MDPFSVATGVIGLLAVIGEVTKSVNGYIAAVQERKQDIRELHQELLLLGASLGQLKDFLLTQQAKKASFDDGSVLQHAVSSCARRLERVGDRLKPSSSGKLARTIDKLRWPFEQDEVKKLVESLQRFTQTFSFALSAKGLEILSSTSEVAETTLKEQRVISQQTLEFLRQNAISTAEMEAKMADAEKMLALLPTLLDQAGEIREVSLHLRLQEEREQARHKAEILEWLAPAVSLQRHVETQRKRVSHTCEWFLQSQLFEEWHALDRPAHDMLCLGSPGVGKTVLASFIFDLLRKTYHNQGVMVVNYYCSHFEEQTQIASHFAKVVLRQICQTLDRLPSAVVEFYRESRHNLEDVLWLQELLSVLRRVLSTCEQVFFVLDALDEIEDVRQRQALLKVLQDVRSANTQVRVLATARPHVSQLQTFFNRPSITDISARPEDVKRYLKQQIDEHPDLELIDSTFQQEIIEILTSSSSGTFLLPALQLSNVLQQITKSDMRRALSELSTTLDEAFKTSLDRIRGLPTARRDLALRTMMWVSYAKRPLHITELQQALATREEQEELDPDNIVPVRVIIESCAGLVQLDHGTDTVSYFHFSIDEYLRSQAGILPDSELPVARTCLSYLLYSSLKSLAILRDANRIAEFLDKHAFFRYAAYYWGAHSRELIVGSYSDLALRLLSSSLHMLAISHLRHLDSPYAKNWEKVATTWAYNPAAGISIAAYFGLADLIVLLLSRLEDKSVINSCYNVHGNLPLQDAAGYGHKNVCEVLIAHGANLMDTNKRKSTPFYHAVTYGYIDTAKALLKHNRAQLDTHCRGGWTALHKAADLGDEEMVIFLLQEGALVAAIDERHRTALHVSAKRGRTAIVRLLVLAGAEVNAVSREETALDLCSTSGFAEVARYLIEQGAIVEHSGRDGWTPLFRACRGGHLEVVKLLLHAGADVLYQDHRQNICLFMACRSGALSIVRVLLEHDPSLRAQLLRQRDQRHRNAQQLALITAHIDIYKYLRDLESQLDAGSNPLQLEISNPLAQIARSIEAKDLVAVELHLRRTPKLLHCSDSSGQMPIHTAFLESAEEIATFLLDLGASIRSVGFHGWQPLHIAASLGSLEMTEIALKYGADLECKTGTLQTPLLKAASSNSVAVIRRLLEAGADIRARNDRGMTCLHIAAHKKFMDGIRELLQPEWNAQDLVHATDRNKNLPRDWANRTGDWEAATYLRLQERLTANHSGKGAKSWTGSNPYLISRTTTSSSQISLTSFTPPNRTPSGIGANEEIDMFAQMVLENDSD